MEETKTRKDQDQENSVKNAGRPVNATTTTAVKKTSLDVMLLEVPRIGISENP